MWHLISGWDEGATIEGRGRRRGQAMVDLKAACVDDGYFPTHLIQAEDINKHVRVVVVSVLEHRAQCSNQLPPFHAVEV
jgi:hypothetical protein